MSDIEPIGTGTVYESNGSKYIYLKRAAVEALGASGGDTVDVFVADGHLEVRPQAGDVASVVRCCYCERAVRRDEIAEHHLETHPSRRYDPAWYCDDVTVES